MDEFTEEEVLDFIKSKKPLNVILERPIVDFVTSGTGTQEEPTLSTTECYQLPSKGPIGFALILNIMEFENDYKNEWRRHASEKDVDYLTDLLIQLNFKVFLFPEKRHELYKKNRAKKEMERHIKDFKDECERMKPASIIVFVGSHGDLCNIWTSDFNPNDPGTYNTLRVRQDIVYQFSDTNCPALKGKPKIFLFQACQGIPESGEQPQEPDATVNDVYICTPTIPGELANRDFYKGSHLIFCFTYMMMKYALKKKSFKEILRKVESMLEQMETDDENKLCRLGEPLDKLDKQLYFCQRSSGERTVNTSCRIPAGIKRFMGNDDTTKFCIVQTPDATMTFEKIWEDIRKEEIKSNCHFTEMKNFLVLMSSNDIVPNLLHVVRNCSFKDIKSFLHDLESFPSDQVRKVILLTSEDKDKIQKLIQEKPITKSIKVDLQLDPMTWGDLSPAYKSQIRRKLEIYYKIVTEHIHIGGAGLVDLIGGRSLFIETLPEKMSHYVSRTLHSRNTISHKIFESESTDIFVIRGIEPSKLDRLARGKKTVTSGEYLLKIPGQFVSLDTNFPHSHFKAICERREGVPVHLLDYEDCWYKVWGVLKWITSEGDIAVIQACVAASKEQVQNREWQFCSNADAHSNKPILICDSPGMGKSLLLQELGRILKMVYTYRTVIFIELSRFIQNYKKIGRTLDLSNVKKTLLKMIGKHPMGEAVLEYKLNSRIISVELLLDGFDEVNSADTDTALNILQLIKGMKSTRMWVTSRPHLMNKLEDKLSSLGYNIQPFSQDDQINFLEGFWSSEGNLHTIRLKQFAENCLRSLKKTISSTDQDIAGIPLQCQLIGEVYENGAKDYARLDNEAPEPLKDLDIGTVSNLYKKLIRRKLDIYKRVHGLDHLNEEMAMMMHVRLSLELFFPMEFPKVQNLFNPVQIKEVFKIGILDAKGGVISPRFVHRTYAEYMVAWFVVERLTRQVGVAETLTTVIVESFLGRFLNLRGRTGVGWDEELIRLFIEKVLKTEPKEDTFEFKYPMIVYFVNDIITEKIPNQATRHYLDMILINSKEIAIQVAHACGYMDFPNLLRFFGATEAFSRHSSTIFDHGFLSLLVKKSGRQLVEYGFIQFEEHHEFDSDVQIQILRSAVKRGNYSIIKFLLNEKNLLKIVTKLPDGLKLLLHGCVVDTVNKPEAEIMERIQVAKLLVKGNKNLLEMKDNYGRTPLLLRLGNVDIRILTTLIELEANVLARDYENETILHVNNYYSSEDFHTLVSRVLTKHENKLKQLVKEECDQKKTVLYRSIEVIDAQPRTLEIFNEMGANFRHKAFGHSLFASAITWGRNKETLETLFDYGAYDPLDNEERLLHIAARARNYDALDILVNKCRLNVNSLDWLGNTLLDDVIKSCDTFGKRYELGLALGRLGGRISNVNGPSLLTAAYEGDLDSVRLLLHFGVEVNNVRDEQRNTPLHCLVKPFKNKDYANCFPIARLLLDADMSLLHQTNADNQTPFDIANYEQGQTRLQRDWNNRYFITSETLALLKPHVQTNL